jgi:Tfp pilus assembly protein PilE
MKKGFTLVEIGVVGAVVSVLVVAAIAGFKEARNASSSLSCMANLRQLDGAKAQLALQASPPENYPIQMKHLVPNYIKKIPTCPMKGDYHIGNIVTQVKCTYHSVDNNDNDSGDGSNPSNPGR